MKKLLCAAAVALACSNATAQTSINLSQYTLSGNYALDTLGGLGLEASAVTYARDRSSLFVVGDEGGGVVEISRTGQTISTMTFSNWPAISTNNDAEGLAYLGGGVLVVAEERLQDLYRFDYVAGGSVALASAPFVSIGATVGNVGTEGITYDARDGQFFSVKQANPQAVLGGSVSFSPSGGTSNMTSLFNPALLGVASLSDIQTLSPIDALAGTSAADNFLILSLDSRRLVEVNRSGQTLSSLDLTGLTTQAIEGVTVDENGFIYLVAESAGASPSRLFVLAPIPEPETYALMFTGLAAIAWQLKKKAKRTGLLLPGHRNG